MIDDDVQYDINKYIEKILATLNGMGDIEDLTTEIDRKIYFAAKDDIENLKKAISGFGGYAVQPVLGRLQQSDLDFSSKRELLDILAMIGEPCIVPLLKEMNNKSKSTRCEIESLDVCDVLEYIGDASIPYILDLLCGKIGQSVEYPHDRDNFLMLLVKFGFDAADQILNKLSTESDESCINELKHILVQLGEPAAEKVIQMRMSNDYKSLTYDEMVDVLVRLGTYATNRLKKYIEFGTYNQQVIAADFFDQTNGSVLEIIQEQNYEPESKSLYNLDMIDGNELELGITNLYAKMGYNIEPTTQTRDYGADFIATKRGEERIAVQVKKRNKSTPITAVQEAATAIRFYFCTRAEVVSTSTFSEEVEKLAGINNVKLIDRSRLEALIEKYN